MARVVILDRLHSKARLDLAILGLALLLFVSPWLLDYSGLAIAAATAWISAIVIAVATVAATIHFSEWEEWVNLAVSGWLIIAPWVLDFRYLNGAAAAFVGIGCFIFAISVSDLWGLYRARREEKRRTASR